MTGPFHRPVSRMNPEKQKHDTYQQKHDTYQQKHISKKHDTYKQKT
jgi:hypothetical protein